MLVASLPHKSSKFNIQYVINHCNASFNLPFGKKPVSPP